MPSHAPRGTPAAGPSSYPSSFAKDSRHQHDEDAGRGGGGGVVLEDTLRGLSEHDYTICTALKNHLECYAQHKALERK